MKPKIVSLILCLTIVFVPAGGQAFSKLVKPCENGKLEYLAYSNKGEEIKVNQIPDFSYAGYRFGGIELPQLPVEIRLSPMEGDNRQQIQNAIDQLSAVPPDENGFRGTILLSSGTYPVNGPIYISASGIVLRGEGQYPGSDGGTEIIATASRQHDFINFSGPAGSSNISGLPLDTILIPKAVIPSEDDGDFWLVGDITAAAEIEYQGDKTISLQLITDVNDFASFASKENLTDSIHPFLEVSVRLASEEKDSVFILAPEDDSFIRGAEYNTDNYGDAVSLPLKNNGYDGHVTREIFFKFHLPEVEGSVISASLLLWCNNAGNNMDMNVFVIFLSNDNWTEHKITYLDNPSSAMVSDIVSDFVPTGAQSVEVENGSLFREGDWVSILRTPNQAWIDLLGMGQYGWTPEAYRVAYERRLTHISGNRLDFDIPLVQSIATEHGGGQVILSDSGGIPHNCGIENMFISSSYTSEEDEEHGWVAIKLSNVKNCWVKNVTGRYFGYGLVNITGASCITVQDCAMLDPKSITTGGRKYSFNIAGGSFNLFQRCYTRGGRHDYATGSKVPGPNVFVDCVAEDSHADIGPHHRYATGTLFDNILGGEIRVWNRGSMGTGHGWAGAQTMFWNLKSVSHYIRVDSPEAAMNWGIGCTGLVKTGIGYWESWGVNVLPRSLYYAQLEDRLGLEALSKTTIAVQHSGRIYDLIKNWRGYGPLTGYLPSNNAKLADLRINGETIEGFSPDRYEYSLEMETGQSGLPDLTYFPYFDSSEVYVLLPESLPGIVIFEVSAEDGSKSSYSIEFTKSTTGFSGNTSIDLSLYPNPATDILYIKTSSLKPIKNIQVLDLTGRILPTRDINKNTGHLSVGHLNTGLYWLIVTDHDNYSKRRCFVKK